MTPDNNHEEIKRLLVENQRLLIENNQLLHKMRRTALISSFFRLVWFVIVVSIPIYIYFNYIQPNIDSIKAKIDNFEQLSSDADFLKKFSDTLKSGKVSE